MDEWNVFSNGEEPGIEHILGEPMAEEELCDCGDPIKSHDRLGCMSKGCKCTKTLHQLTYLKEKK